MADSDKITKNVVVVGIMTSISRFGGLVRDIFLANYFGTSTIKSAFDLAYRIPNLFRRLFGEGALSQALIPVYTEVRENEGEEAANRLATSVAGAVTALLFAVSAVAILATYPIEHWLNPGSRWVPVMPLLRIVFLYAPLICLAAIVMAVLNSLKSFAISALAPAFQNLCMIAAIVCVCPLIPEEMPKMKVVAWSILVSGIIQVAVQLPTLKRFGVPLKLSLKGFESPAFKKVVSLTLPMAFSAGIFQINTLLDSVLAMHASEWGPSVLSYADRLVYFPLAIVGTAFGTVLLPTLSSFTAKRDYESFSRSFKQTMSNTIVVLTPATVGMIVLAHRIISLIYRTGAFDALSTQRTANALAAYSVGLVAAGLYKVIIPAFYSRKDSRTPVVVAIYGVILNLALNILFITILPYEWKAIGIAIATVITSILSCVILLFILSRTTENGVRLFSFKSMIRVTLSSLAASIAMGAALFFLTIYSSIAAADSGIDTNGKLFLILIVAVSIALGLILYAAILYLICPSALKNLISDFRRRKSKS